jgi:hypothetical protein
MLSKWFKNHLTTTLASGNPKEKKDQNRQPASHIIMAKNMSMPKEGLLSEKFNSPGRVSFPYLMGKPPPIKFSISSFSSSIQRNQQWAFRPFQIQLRLPLNQQLRQQQLQQKVDSKRNTPGLSHVQILLILNGLYDLACACCILWFSSVPWLSFLSDLHPTMFENVENEQNPIIRRLLSYWIMTYGSARILAGINSSSTLSTFGALTYFIEAFCFQYEYRVGQTMIASKVMIVSVLCVLLGGLILIRSVSAAFSGTQTEVNRPCKLPLSAS